MDSSVHANANANVNGTSNDNGTLAAAAATSNGAREDRGRTINRTKRAVWYERPTPTVVVSGEAWHAAEQYLRRYQVPPTHTSDCGAGDAGAIDTGITTASTNRVETTSSSATHEVVPTPAASSKLEVGGPLIERLSQLAKQLQLPQLDDSRNRTDRIDRTNRTDRVVDATLGGEPHNSVGDDGEKGSAPAASRSGDCRAFHRNVAELRNVLLVRVGCSCLNILVTRRSDFAYRYQSRQHRIPFLQHVHVMVCGVRWRIVVGVSGLSLFRSVGG